MELLNILYPILLVVVIISMFALIIIVLLQNDKSGGLGILGGSSSQSGFGSRKTDPIVRITQILGALFVLGSFALAFMNSLSTKVEIPDDELYMEEEMEVDENESSVISDEENIIDENVDENNTTDDNNN